jgi:hypothetical protein
LIEPLAARIDTPFKHQTSEKTTMSNAITALQTSPLSTEAANANVIGQLDDRAAAAGKPGLNGTRTDSRQLLAAGGTPIVRAAPVEVINTWATKTLPAIEFRPAPAGGAQTLAPKPGRSTLVPSPAVTIPLGMSRNLQNVVFPTGSTVLTIRGVPQFNGKMSASKTQAIEAALTPAVIGEFNRLNPAQKALARTWLSAAFHNMNLAPNNAAYIATAQLPATIKYVLSLARQASAPGGATTPSAITQKPGAPGLAETPSDAGGTRRVRKADGTPLKPAPKLAETPRATAPRTAEVPSAPVTPTTPTTPTTKPKPTVDATLRANQSLGKLGTSFGSILNPALREVMGEITSGQLKIKRFDTTADPAQLAAGVQRELSAGGRVAAADLKGSSANVIAIARELDVEPVRLAKEISAKEARLNLLASSRDTARPMVVDGVQQPQSVQAGTDYMTALLSRAVPVPARSQTVRFATGNGFSTTEYTVEHGKKILSTQIQSDIDGVYARSYGTAGIEISVRSPDGKSEVPVYIKLNKPLDGEPTRILGVRPDLNNADHKPVVVVEYETKQGSRTTTRRETFPVADDDASVLMKARGLGAQILPVSGLTSRYFSPDAINYLIKVSENNVRGGELPGGPILPTTYLNTFGTMGDPQAPNGITNPGALARSINRSLKGSTSPDGRGIEPLKGLSIVSGGLVETNLSAKKNLAFFLSVPALQKGMKGLAAELPTVMRELATKYQLSESAARDLQKAGFFFPDIPSSIIPSSVVMQLSDRRLSGPPGLGLADFQRELETKSQALVKKHGLSDYLEVHHTPPKPGTADDVAYFGDASAKGTVTTEWQFAVKAQKALGVLNMVSQIATERFGVDLKKPLAAMGYDSSAIRKMGLNDVLRFLSEKVRPILDKKGVSLGKIIVPIDTYVEKGGVVSGSDASMVRAAAALYGAENVAVVQVDTYGGNPAEMGKPAKYRVDVRADGTVYAAEPSVDPLGPNGSLAPTAYVVRPEELGRVSGDAYRRLNRIGADEIRAVRNRGGN